MSAIQIIVDLLPFAAKIRSSGGLRISRKSEDCNLMICTWNLLLDNTSMRILRAGKGHFILINLKIKVYWAVQIKDNGLLDKSSLFVVNFERDFTEALYVNVIRGEIEWRWFGMIREMTDHFPIEGFNCFLGHGGGVWKGIIVLNDDTMM